MILTADNQVPRWPGQVTREAVVKIRQGSRWPDTGLPGETRWLCEKNLVSQMTRWPGGQVALWEKPGARWPGGQVALWGYQTHLMKALTASSPPTSCWVRPVIIWICNCDAFAMYTPVNSNIRLLNSGWDLARPSENNDDHCCDGHGVHNDGHDDGDITEVTLQCIEM